MTKPVDEFELQLGGYDKSMVEVRAKVGFAIQIHTRPTLDREAHLTLDGPIGHVFSLKREALIAMAEGFLKAAEYITRVEDE